MKIACEYSPDQIRDINDRADLLASPSPWLGDTTVRPNTDLGFSQPVVSTPEEIAAANSTRETLLKRAPWLGGSVNITL